jgi:hypothetical protein
MQADTGSASGVQLRIIAGLCLALFAADNVLLLRFLGLSPTLTAILLALACPAIAIMSAHLVKAEIRVPWSAIITAFAVALLLFLLGGEGRFFYANADWQIRDAILADMAKYPWPYAYLLEGKAAILRAPIGLYLMPSLVGGGYQEYAMLLLNGIRLTLLMALCWPLFAKNWQRILALAIFIFFSGMDILGTALYGHLGVDVSWDHLERWNGGYQYSAHVTQLFWVPQHALAGWGCAATYMLWLKGRASIGLFFATAALVAIWSPLAIMGAVPFALLAGVLSLRNKAWDKRDVMLCMAATLLALPALFYMQVDAAKLGTSWRDLGLAPYVILMVLEVLLFILPALLAKTTEQRERWTLYVALACLMLMPYYKIGINSDFQMRASIMPLALVAIIFAQWLIRSIEQVESRRAAVAYSLLVVGLGAATPAFEIARAVRLDPSPKPLCSLAGVWDKQIGLMVAPHATYFAQVDRLPAPLRDIPVLAGRDDPEKCWKRPWVVTGR